MYTYTHVHDVVTSRNLLNRDATRLEIERSHTEKRARSITAREHYATPNVEQCCPFKREISNQDHTQRAPFVYLFRLRDDRTWFEKWVALAESSQHVMSHWRFTDSLTDVRCTEQLIWALFLFSPGPSVPFFVVFSFTPTDWYMFALFLVQRELYIQCHSGERSRSL